MRMADVDLFVIGGGSGGVACARRAAMHGARVALAEASRVGGTCVIRGCVPKKLMSFGAHMAGHFKLARAYGWQLREPALDFPALLEARNLEIQRLNGIYIAMLEKAGVRLHFGRARILTRLGGEYVVEIEGEKVTARHVLIATGARPVLPEIPGVEHAVTSDAILEDVYPLPERLVVLGGGYIGVELASILHGLGAAARIVIRRTTPLAGFDEDVRTELTTALEQRGVALTRGAQPERIEKVRDDVVLHTDRGPIAGDMLLCATGRDPLPNTRGIGLETVGVAFDPKGAIRVDHAYESSVPGILAVGDCSDHTGAVLDSGRFDLTPVAIAEGRAVAERLFNANPSTVAYDVIPTAVFALPQAGAVGLTEAEARARGHSVRVFKARFRPMLQTMALHAGMDASARTFMKLVVDHGTDRVLGCHMVGDDAAEMIQCLAVALTARVTKAELDATMALHPSAAEEWVTMYTPAA
jgi:glutathione reductase (NADPH)